jgi:hypothetical protein
VPDDLRVKINKILDRNQNKKVYMSALMSNTSSMVNIEKIR